MRAGDYQMEVRSKEELLSEYRALLHVLEARVEGYAGSYDDWFTITRQTKMLLRIAENLRDFDQW